MIAHERYYHNGNDVAGHKVKFPNTTKVSYNTNFQRVNLALG